MRKNFDSRLKHLAALVPALEQSQQSPRRGIPYEALEQISRDMIDSDVLSILRDAKTISPAVEPGAMQATARVTRAMQLDQSGKIQGLVAQMLKHVTPDPR